MTASEGDGVASRKRRQADVHADERRDLRRLGRTMRIAGADVYLTPTEYRLLVAFRQRPEHGFTRAELAAQAMPETVVLDRTIDVHVKSLRRKISASPERIETVYGVGYRLVKK